jgi:hypothetical protein
MDRPSDRPATPRWYHRATVSGYCGRPSSSFTQFIFSLTQMCPVGANALRSSNTAGATPAAVPFFRQQNRRVPHVLF